MAAELARAGTVAVVDPGSLLAAQERRGGWISTMDC